MRAEVDVRVYGEALEGLVDVVGGGEAVSGADLDIGHA